MIIEDTGVGTGLIKDLKLNSVNAIAAKPTQSKQDRMRVHSATFEAGRVLFPAKAPWLDRLIAELMAFPASRHDDQVDSISQALEHAKSAPRVRVYKFPVRTYPRYGMW